MGLAVYAFLALGLGCWPGCRSRSGLSVIGLRLALGYALATILVFFLGVVANMPIDATLWIAAAIAACGMLYRSRACRWRIDWLVIARHPACLLMLAGGAAIAVNGGIDYLPVGHDEFGNWLSKPLRLHVLGTWAATAEGIHLPGYTPGWPLMLALPWQVSGEVDFGASAAAPFVLHVAAIAVVFDVVVFLLRRRAALERGIGELAGWAFILLYLAAEALGPLWPRTLLIEPPQILGYTIFLLQIFAAQIAPKDDRTLEISAGVMLASCYLIKSAATMFLPAILLICALRAMSGDKSSWRDRLRGAAISGARLTVPIVVLAVTWRLHIDPAGCINSPLETFTPAALELARGFDWGDLAGRYTGAIWSYAGTYKIALTIAALLGFIAALARGAYRAPLILAITAAGYFAALYWFHLTCFGEYYFENLNSIPRFTRVMLRALHGLGLVLLADVVLTETAKRLGTGELWKPAWQRWLTGIVVMSIVLLGSWQAREVDRSVVVVTTRSGQTIDARIDETRRAAWAIETWKGKRLGARPVLLIMAQASDNAVLDFARFFAMSRQRGITTERFRVVPESSWSPEPANIWQTRADAAHVRRRLAEADIVWPIRLDRWLRRIVGEFVDDPACLRALPAKALLRIRGADPRPRFECLDKPGRGRRRR